MKIKNEKIISIFCAAFILFFINGVIACNDNSGFAGATKPVDKKAAEQTSQEVQLETTSETATQQIKDPETEPAAAENPFFDTKTNKCKPGHKLYIQICVWHGTTALYYPCDTLSGPVADVCDNACDNGVCDWHLARAGFSICVKDQLEPCPADWRIKGIRNCTLDTLDKQEKSSSESTTPTSDAADCPLRHKLYTQDCTLSTGTVQHGVFNPTNTPCLNFCNSIDGCPHQPNGPVGTICAEDELKDCPVNWKMGGVINCYLP